MDILSHPCLREELENTTYGTAALRHRKQMVRCSLITINVFFFLNINFHNFVGRKNNSDISLH